MAFLLNSGIAVSLNNTPTTATYASGGAGAATTVVISAANSNIKIGQKIAGTGLAANSVVTNIAGTTITFSPAATSQISGTLTFSTNWYHLTDHNRNEININPIVIEKESRMANGTLRKFVVSKKDIVSVSWDLVPTSHTNHTAQIQSGTVVGNTIVFVTSAAHNFTTSSSIVVSGLSPSPFNISGVTPSSVTSTTFIVPKPSAATGVSTGTGFAQDVTKVSITTIDGKYGAGWINAFYNANHNIPIYVKVTSADYTTPSSGSMPSDSAHTSALTGEKIYQAFITGFSKSIRKRTRTTDYVDMTLEFTEI
jgi:hypothetical protein